jgi:DNA polymerase-3 subunit chi
MSDILFYHLTQSPVEATLPSLLERSLARDWTVCIRGTDAARLDALDRHLWSYRDDSFLPHGLDSSDHSDLQPIVLTTKNEMPNQADVLMLLDGAWDEPERLATYARVCVFFDGNDPDAVEDARAHWAKFKENDLSLKYWAQEGGSWVQKA